MISLLPFWVLYACSDVLFVLLYYVIGYRRQVVYENLTNAFPDKTHKERMEIARKFYRFLPDLIVEAIKMRSMSAKEVNKRMAYRQPEELERHFELGKDIIALTAHYGNWEWGIHKISVSTKNPALIIYKPLSNKTINEIYNRIRSRFGAIMVPMKQTLRKVLEYRNRPHISVFVADQTPSYTESDYYVQFLNQNTLVFMGAEKIARKTNAPVIFCHIDRIKRGYYCCTFTTLVENPAETAEHEVTDLYNKFTEDIIRNKPELWLWSHRRWKRKPKQ
ncbi:lysophospholipid acyltransferase family protein [Parapedobacter tibetensis]|uniref:lysophospholipid acyltransferase family protein n=1 Tax=Parapedobacter tibetensis TaxID=2972951 RepID=UPI00214D3D77|nr:lysophospholipid acyltransferase family protein [Parapedobacter tibetensis]